MLGQSVSGLLFARTPEFAPYGKIQPKRKDRIAFERQGIDGNLQKPNDL
jgi:hypothetical protein